MSAASERRDRRTRPVSMHAGNALYCLGVVGAWVWFWQQENGFWGHVWALVEGVLWPAFMVYEGFSALH